MHQVLGLMKRDPLPTKLRAQERFSVMSRNIQAKTQNSKPKSLLEVLKRGLALWPNGLNCCLKRSRHPIWVLHCQSNCCYCTWESSWGWPKYLGPWEKSLTPGFEALWGVKQKTEDVFVSISSLYNFPFQ